MKNIIEIIATELAGDPLARGYSGMDDAAVADSLNNTKDRQVSSGAVRRQDVLSAIIGDDYDRLTDAHKNRFWSVVSSEEIAADGLEIRELVAMFGAGATTTALSALATETISRGRELGVGKVEPGHVDEARR
jgi:hypothetical protein